MAAKTVASSVEVKAEKTVGNLAASLVEPWVGQPLAAAKAEPMALLWDATTVRKRVAVKVAQMAC